MSKPIYNMFLVRGLTERWLRLAQAEQNALLLQLNEALSAAGGRRMIACDSYWHDEGYRGWGVEEFPDFASWRQFAAAREKLEWYSYLESWSMLGTWHEAVNPAECAAPEPGKIYQLALLRPLSEAYEQLTQSEKEALWAKEAESRQGTDAKWIMAANSYWASEEYTGFGVFMYSDIDAVQRHFADLERISWPRYIRARTLLGTLWGG